MTLYARLTLALMGAAAGGATGLVLAVSATMAPALTWGLLLGGMLGLAAFLARWVLRPLRRLAADVEGTGPPPVDRTLEHLTRAFAVLRDRLAEREAEVEEQVTGRVRDLVVAQRGLALLFDAVAGDALAASDAEFASRFLSHWVREGPVQAVGVWWQGGAPPTFLSAGDAPIHPDRLPHGLLEALEHAADPVVAPHGDLAWLGVPVPHPAGGPAATGPRALVAAWPADRPPEDSERVACAALARYLAIRSAAHGATPARPDTGAAPEAAPNPGPDAAPREAPRPAPATARTDPEREP